MRNKTVLLCLSLFVVGIGGIAFYRLEHVQVPDVGALGARAKEPATADASTTPVQPAAVTATGVQPAGSLKERNPEAAAFVERGEANRKAKAAQYQDEIDFIRANFNHPDREKVIDSILEECFSGPISDEDAIYIFLEKHKYELSRGKFHWLYIDRAITRYEWNAAYDLAIQNLDEAIHMVESEDLDFDCYRELLMDTPKAKAAVIQDLRKRRSELERRKAGEPPSPLAPFRTDENVMPGNKILRSGLSPEAKEQEEEAKAAVLAGDYDTAIRRYESMGDRENAAALMLRKSRRVGFEAGLQAVDEVIAKYPGTVQAALAEYRRAELYREANRPDDAVQTLKKFVREQPNSSMRAVALHDLGIFAKEEGSIEDAIGYFEQCLEHQREKEKTVAPSVVQMLSMLYEERGEHDKTDKLLSDTILALEGGTLAASDDGSSLHRMQMIQQLQGLHATLKQMRKTKMSKP